MGRLLCSGGTFCLFADWWWLLPNSVWELCNDSMYQPVVRDESVVSRPVSIQMLCMLPTVPTLTVVCCCGDVSPAVVSLDLRRAKCGCWGAVPWPFFLFVGHRWLGYVKCYGVVWTFCGTATGWVTCRTYIYLNGIAGSVKVANMWVAGSTVGVRFLCIYYVLCCLYVAGIMTGWLFAY